MIEGMSKNENTGRSQVCTFDMVFIVVDVNSKALWPTGLQVPDTYYANFPG